MPRAKELEPTAGLFESKSQEKRIARILDKAVEKRIRASARSVPKTKIRLPGGAGRKAQKSILGAALRRGPRRPKGWSQQALAADEGAGHRQPVVPLRAHDRHEGPSVQGFDERQGRQVDEGDGHGGRRTFPTSNAKPQSRSCRGSKSADGNANSTSSFCSTGRRSTCPRREAGRHART